MKYQGRLDASLIGETVKVNTWAGGYRIIKVDNFEEKGLFPNTLYEIGRWVRISRPAAAANV